MTVSMVGPWAPPKPSDHPTGGTIPCGRGRLLGSCASQLGRVRGITTMIYIVNGRRKQMLNHWK